MVDPFNLIAKSEKIMRRAKDVKIHRAKTTKIASIIGKQIKKKNLLTASQFGVIDQTDNGAQLVFLEDTVNFCFWPSRGEPKWQVQNENKKLTDGWVALTMCFRRALASGVPILGTDYIQRASLQDWQKFFQGENSVEIPLFSKRVANLREAAKVLQAKYDGHFKNVILVSKRNAVKLVKLISRDFPSFRDPFLKRAQIIVYDIYLMFEGKNRGNLKNIDKLTAFADYKLPQILRELGVLEYSQNLANKVDSQQEIPSGTAQEEEIRAATIIAVELFKQHLPNIISPQIDNVLWSLSQNNRFTPRPYHRTRTIFY